MSLRISRALNALNRRWSQLDFSRGINHIVKEHHRTLDEVCEMHALNEDEKKTVVRLALRNEEIAECQTK